ncbi:Piwi-domain-containing protein [Auricularia subglabra TFB-10046 SS5]|nr:Piwi-domain-containing protein [Auricularia subglabra TFB-10046 SS5]
MRQGVLDFVKRLFARLRSLGLTGPGLDREHYPGAFQIVQAVQGGNVREYVADITRKFGNTKPSLIIAVMPNPSDAERIAIKRIGDVEQGFATQVVRADRIVGNGLPKDDYMNNLACNSSYRINLKLGGINWVLGMPSVPGYITETESLPATMIIGADVSHPAPNNLTSPSICGVVATIHKTLVKYSGVSCVQMGGRRVEVIHGLKDMLKPMFKQFRGKLNDWPRQILYYRDGVGETQLAEVTRVEKQAILAALREAQMELNEPGAPFPKLTFIVVSKRHHQRFFPDSGDRNGNCFPGSVFDEGIASPTLFDFYLQSQAAIQGTARPAHYVVTHNENPVLNADSLQKFTFDLCHTYERATRSVSIPPPVYYADLLCRRGKFMFPPDLDFSDVAGGQNDAALLQYYQANYAQIHEDQRDRMYFV